MLTTFAFSHSQTQAQAQAQAQTEKSAPADRSLKVSVSSETGRLRSVVIGTADNVDIAGTEIINETQKQYYFGPNRPTRANLISQMEQYAAMLEQLGVQVFRVRPLADFTDQMMPRDIGVTIGEKLLISNMAKPSRRGEWRGIEHVLDLIPDHHIVRPPIDVIFEGGDIVVDKGMIFVGLSQRTQLAAVEYLAAEFPHYQVVPMPLKSVAEGENILHLDCGFVPVGDHFALTYVDGLRHVPAVLRERYELIPVTRAEQDMLGTNVLSVSPTQLISREDSHRINQELRMRGIDVVELPYSDPPKTGGSFRCGSLPLWRE